MLLSSCAMWFMGTRAGSVRRESQSPLLSNRPALCISAQTVHLLGPWQTFWSRMLGKVCVSRTTLYFVYRIQSSIIRIMFWHFNPIVHIITFLVIELWLSPIQCSREKERWGGSGRCRIGPSPIPMDYRSQWISSAENGWTLSRTAHHCTSDVYRLRSEVWEANSFGNQKRKQMGKSYLFGILSPQSNGCQKLSKGELVFLHTNLYITCSCYKVYLHNSFS